MTDGSNLADEIAGARHDLAAGRRDEAWQTMASLVQRFPHDTRVALEAGLIGLRSGHSMEAAQVLRDLTSSQPRIGMGWALLGEALTSLNDRPAAAAAYRRAIELEPNDARVNIAAGMALANLDEPVDAIAALSRVAASDNAPFAVQARLAGLLLLHAGAAQAQSAFDAAVAAMTANLQAGRLDEALINESQLDQWFVRPVESEEHAERCFAAWRGAMTDAGRKAAAALPPVESSQGRRDIPVVGFFLHSASLLGHVELTLDYLAAMKDAMAIEPRIYVFSGGHHGLQEEARRRGLPLVFVEAEWPGGKATLPYQKLLWLRDRLARDCVEALVWVSVPHFVHFGAALGVAPINIFWALRFRPVVSPYVQGYVACASCFEHQDMVNGRPWDLIPLAFRDLAGPPRSEEAAAIRRALGNPPVIFGTLARGEKMQGSAWLAAIGLTLKACPQAVFLWAGRTEDARVAGALREMGVAGQSRFIGWVDTRLYAQVLDIFLDTAPVGCGMTAMQAMAWGKPLVSFKDPLTNWGQCLRPALEGRVADAEAKAAIESIFALGSDRELLAWADTPQGYAALAQRLADDREYRAAVGAAGKTFTERYFGSPAYAAERFASAIRAIVARARRPA